MVELEVEIVGFGADLELSRKTMKPLQVKSGTRWLYHNRKLEELSLMLESMWTIVLKVRDSERLEDALESIITMIEAGTKKIGKRLKKDRFL